MKKLQTFLLAVLIFLIPSNLFLKLGESTAYVNGLLVDYLIPKLYASDLVLIALIGVMGWEWLSQLKKAKKIPKETNKVFHRLGIFILVTILLLRQFFSQNPVGSLSFSIHALLIGVFAFLLSKKKALLNSEIIKYAWCVSLVTQSVIGIAQFIFQRSLFPSYLFLGEARLHQTIGIARTQFFSIGQRLLPYGTTSHPNTLAGFLVIGLLILWSFTPSTRKSQTFVLFTTRLALIALFFTQSFSAWLALLLGILWFSGVGKYLRGNLNRLFAPLFGLFIASLIAFPFIISFLAQSISSPSIIRRDYLQAAAWQMFKAFPLTGVGLNNFTVWVEKFSTAPEIVRFVQPVHHLGLLLLAETGILGILLIAQIISYLLTYHRQILTKILLLSVILLPIFVFDHYLLTQQTGLLMAVFFFLHYASAPAEA